MLSNPKDAYAGSFLGRPSDGGSVLYALRALRARKAPGVSVVTGAYFWQRGQ